MKTPSLQLLSAHGHLKYEAEKLTEEWGGGGGAD